MKAAVFSKDAQHIIIDKRPIPQPGPGEVVVRLHAAALNHRDVWVYKGLLKKVQSNLPLDNASFIFGSDGSGVIEQIGEGVSAWKIGEEVIINPQTSCGKCYHCLAGEHSLCTAEGALGSPLDGTFASYIKVPEQKIIRKPSHLTHSEAASLSLALGTAWRALQTLAKLQPGETVLIHGIGGGVALYALQIAVMIGARAIVTSSSEEKLERAIKLGAFAGVNYKTEDVIERVKELTDNEGVDVVVDGVGKNTLPISLAAARKGGRIVNFSTHTGVTYEINGADLVFKQLRLFGTCMFSQAELSDAIRFVSLTHLKPLISSVYPLQDIVKAFAELEQGNQFGKVVLDMGVTKCLGSL